MKYLYSKEQIDKAIKRIKRFRCCKVYLSDHFAGGLNTFIEVCGLGYDDYDKIEKINKILSEELGEDAYLECYDCMCHICYVGKDDQAQKGSKYDPIVLDGKDLSVYPDMIFFGFQNLWKHLTLEIGDRGTCKLGAYVEFIYKEKYYILKPLDFLQGSLGREICFPQIESLLKLMGCLKIKFYRGRDD